MKIYDNIMQRIPQYEEKRGIKYAKTDGRLYKTINVFYIIALVYTSVMNLLCVLGIYMFMWDYTNAKNTFYTVLCLTLALIAAYILTAFKKHILPMLCSFVLTALSYVGLVISLARSLENEIGGYKASFYWRHFVPLCLVLVFNIIAAFIAVRANIKQKNIYKKLVENIYESNKNDDGENIAESDWDEILKNYE